MKILIATNNSKCSVDAVETLLSRRWAPDDQFRVLCVVEMIIGQYPMAVTYVDGMMEGQRVLLEQGKEIVEKTMAQLRSKFPQNTTTGNVGEGCPADFILREAKSWHADLIVLGTHSRKGISKLVHGSVSETVAAHASCAVEIMK